MEGALRGSFYFMADVFIPHSCYIREASQSAPGFRMRLWSSVLSVTAAAVMTLLAAFFIVGPERVWMLYGPPDLGPVSFETLKRQTSANNALACPQDLCMAKSDIAPPVFAVGAPDLARAFAKIMASEANVEQVDVDDGGLTRRYVQRTKILRFPDTICVRFIDLGEGRSTIALYSRSQFGLSDFGVNRARISRWLEKLEKEAPAVKTA